MSALKIVGGANDNYALYIGLVDGLKVMRSDPAPYVNDATGTIQLIDATGAAIGSEQSWSYIAGSNGDYYAMFDETYSLTAGDVISARVVMSTPGGLNLDRTYSGITVVAGN